MKGMLTVIFALVLTLEIISAYTSSMGSVFELTGTTAENIITQVVPQGTSLQPSNATSAKSSSTRRG